MSPPDALSEVEAYEYIRRQLRDVGWIVRNPSLNTGGQVWTQNQCLSHPTIKQALGKMRPENIVKLTERYLWVIEAKASRNEIDLAVKEALYDYSPPINDLDGDVEVLLASGVAGDEASGFAVRTYVRLNGDWHQVTINGKDATGLLSPADADVLVVNKDTDSDIHEFSPPSGSSCKPQNASMRSSIAAVSIRTTGQRRWRRFYFRSSISRRTSIQSCSFSLKRSTPVARPF
jgi:hypothetical protein